MELKWIEDLVVLARTGHFARAAEIRLVTQSALSRRIQSLERWVGAQLVDRTRHPIELTPAGREFIEPAQDIVKMAYEAQSAASNSMYASHSEVRINTLHSLSMRQIPKLVQLLKQRIGDFDVAVDTSARTVEEDMHNLRSELCDYYIGVRHPAFEYGMNIDRFPRMQIFQERLLPYAKDPAMFESLAPDSTAPVPLVSLNRSAVTSRTMQSILTNAPFSPRIHTTYRATTAEAVRQAVIEGMGIAWLPESIMRQRDGENLLTAYDGGYQMELSVEIIRSITNERPIINRIWKELEKNRDEGVYRGMSL